MRAVAIDVDGVLGDTGPIWRDWLADVTRRARVGEKLSPDPAEAAARLDELVGNWRTLLERFAEEHVAVYLRPSSDASRALRRLQAAGVRIGAFTDAPEPLARVAVAHLGAGRRLDALETGPGALERLLDRLGPDAVVVRTRDQLLGLRQ